MLCAIVTILASHPSHSSCCHHSSNFGSRVLAVLPCIEYPREVVGEEVYVSDTASLPPC
jgi:hypothetical protein